jgi:hypothetical protein
MAAAIGKACGRIYHAMARRSGPIVVHINSARRP